MGSLDKVMSDAYGDEPWNNPCEECVALQDEVDKLRDLVGASLSEVERLQEENKRLRDDIFQLASEVPCD